MAAAGSQGPGFTEARNGAFVVIRSRSQGFAIPTGHVRDVAMMPRVVRIPGSPAEVRGMIDFRGEVVPVADLRLLLGQQSREEEIHELVRLLDEREQDHLNWIRQLEIAVREGSPFTLGRDPHQCKFGRWYDTYQPLHSTLAILWSRFDRPHQTIHALADQVLAMSGRGDHDGALAVITKARDTELLLLVELFAEARRGLRDDARELVMVLSAEDKRIGLAIDSAEAVEEAADAEFLELPDSLPRATLQLVTAVMKWPNREETVLCLDAGAMVARYSTAGGTGAAAA